MTKPEAIEKLAADRDAQVAATVAKRHAIANDLYALDLDELAEVYADAEPGVNVNGWVNPYPPDNPKSLLFEYQYEFWHHPAKLLAWLAARQIGKDFTSEGFAVEDCQLQPGAQWMIAAPSERQALDSLDQGKTWAGAFDLAIEGWNIERANANPQSLILASEIQFSNGSRMRAVPGRPDTVRGRSASTLLTEFDFFEDPVATWRAMFPSITSELRGGKKKVRAISTPNGKGRMMYDIFHDDDPEALWQRFTTTIYHAALMGNRRDIAQIQKAYKFDPDGFAQEFLCRFLDSSNVLLPYELIALAESAEASEVWSPDDAGTSDPLFVGIDFGRTTDPTVAITLQLVGGVLWTREVLVLRKMSTPDQEEILRSRVERARRVCLDYTGPGIGLGDYLVKRHGEWKPDAHQLNGKVELCTFTPKLTRQLYPRLRRRFEAPTTLRVPISTEFREDLHSMNQRVSSTGAYSYQSPRTAAGHSDRCVALALAVRAHDLTPEGDVTVGTAAGLGGRSTRELGQRSGVLSTLKRAIGL